MSEAKIKVRITHSSWSTREINTHNLKRGSLTSASSGQCESCRERKRGHVGGEERRSLNQGKGKTKNYQKDLAILCVSDISRSIQESLRLRKTLRV